ncbi:glucosyltransferase [Scheffersomyces xylosifermentans]|uniref:glucosyltransferase n=1 Tax=Scheffersomyces xylosifermentans TaxID=1304137 RepID=UPI00315CB932
MPLVVTQSRPVIGLLVVKVLFVVLFFGFCGLVHHEVAKKVKSPFIDEIFHLRQCQKYCQYKFHEWDNKITTPPGLYLLGFLYTNVLTLITGSKSICENIDVLRSLNILGGLVVFPIALRIFKRSNPNQFWSINVISQPLLFTYYFLFYTDIWSTVLIVSSLALVVNKPLNDYSSYLSGFLAFASIWFRQTNIIWTAFILAVLVDRRIIKKRGENPNVISQTISFIIQFFKDWYKTIPFLVNFVLFAIFLKINGGITFGDKENHEIQLHVVQVFYCFVFIVAFTWPVWFSLSTITNYVKFVIVANYGLNLVLNALAIFVIKLIIDKFTVVHPFLLADNRHYTFYIFKRLISHRYSQFVAVPLYHFSTYAVLSTLGATVRLSMTFVTIACYLVAICLTIIPSPLFEPRYYIVPLIIFRLFIKPVSQRRHIFEFLWLNLINVATVTVFFNYEFYWISEPGVIQRIIW